jgi:hypothetical protein
MERMDGDEKIDGILSRDDEILPSPGFAVSVMNAVRQEAAAPPPIPFPWKRALPGVVVAGLAFVLIPAVIVAAIAQRGEVRAAAYGAVSVPSMLPSLLQPNLEGALIWAVLASLAAFLSTNLSMRLASGTL